MFLTRNRLVFVFALVCLFSVTTAKASERWVIQFKQSQSAQENARQTRLSALQKQQEIGALVNELSRVHKRQFTMVRGFGNQGAIVVLPKGSTENMEQVRQRLESDPRVESVALDRRIRLRAQSPLIGLLNGLDPSRQSRSWFHQAVSTQPASMNSAALWTNFHGTAPTVVAVLDTGVLPSHPMLQGHLLAGYDFVADPFIGADGQGSSGSDRDADPTDPGDGVTPADLLFDPACGAVSQSSWHGSFVSGLLAGNPIVSEGIFPVNWNAVVLPVRVLGKCGGFSTDLADGIRWAAGLNVPGVPNNPFPAKVINLSLGAEGECVGAIEGAAVAAARQAGALVVVASGNDGGSVDSPANCPGAFGVGALDQQGLKANYSNYGSSIQLFAPGGDAAFPIWSASNTGVASALTNTYNTKIGTSFSAPLVAGSASLYWSVNPSASVASVEALLKSTARPFLSFSNRQVCSVDRPGVECNCTTALCGAGMLDVFRLVSGAAPGGLTNLFSISGNVIAPGSSGVFSAEGSLDSTGQEVAAVSFDLINIVKSDSSAPDPVLSSTGLTVEVAAPAGVLGFDLRAQVANGRTAIASIVVQNPGATSPTLLASLLSPLINGASSGIGLPSSPVGNVVLDGSDSPPAGGGSSSGGGGGALQLYGLLGLLFLLVCFKRTK